jgi:glycosyltransferase involved in cell wall biosynthesis
MERPWNAVYVNGMYSRWYSIEPLRLLRGSGTRTIVAVRGMLAPGMMAHGTLKKRVFLAVMKIAGCYRGVEFQVTNAQEVLDVKRWIGADAVVHEVPNLPRRAPGALLPRRSKTAGVLRLVSVARIAVEKNTLFAIERLREVRGRITFDLVGPIYDQGYWRACLEAMDSLPQGVRVEHKGDVRPDRIPEMLLDYHALLMPSHGENFGHAMAEALAAGLPLVISDRTPWKGLEAANAGWDLPLGDPSRFREVLQRLVDMDEATYLQWSRGAFELGRRYLSDPANVEKCFALFQRP